MSGPLGPISIGAIVTAGVGILGSIFTPGPDKALNRLLIWTAIVCLYGFWLMVYKSQLNPILRPVDTRFNDPTLDYNTLLEIAQHWNENNGPQNG